MSNGLVSVSEQLTRRASARVGQAAMVPELTARELLPLILRTVITDQSDEEEADLWRAMQTKCAELTALVMQCRDPGAGEAWVLRMLPKKFEFAGELLYGKRKPVIGGADAERLALLEIVSGGRDHA